MSSDANNSVVVTGIGCVTPLGWSVETTWRALATGGPPPSQRTAPVDDRHIIDYMPQRKDIHKMDRRARLAMSAALEAVGMSKLRCADASYQRGVSVGVGLSDLGVEKLTKAVQRCVLSHQPQQQEVIQALAKTLSPRWLLPQLPNMTAAHLAIAFRAQGPVHTSSDTVVGGQALRLGVELILDGQADVVLAGEVDASLEIREMATSSRNCTEAAGFLIFEKKAHAQVRGAKILAEVRRFGEGELAPEPTLGEALPDLPSAHDRRRLGEMGVASSAIGAVLAIRNLWTGMPPQTSYGGLWFVEEVK